MQCIDETTSHGTRYRARLKYINQDGSVVNLGPFQIDDLSELASLKTAKESIALAQLKKRDAYEAMAENRTTSHKNASRNDVLRAYMSSGIDQADTLQAYKILSKVANQVLGMGYSDEQYAAAFDTTIERVQQLKARWQYLKDNKSVIEAYDAVVAGDTL